MKIRMAGIVKESIVDGPGIRFVLFVQGCLHNCLGCHNPETHDLSGGCEIDTQDIIRDIMSAPFLNGVTFSGGEPFLQADKLWEVAKAVKEKDYNIAAYTGFLFEELINNSSPSVRKLLELTDILIDGKFKIEEKDLSLKFRGSKNQRVIDVKKSMASGSVVLYCK
jgi:anaerobic ribonucleoside-triphosphate reductase activating protein